MGQVRHITGVEKRTAGLERNIKALNLKSRRSDQRLHHILHEDEYQMNHKISGVESRGRLRVKPRKLFSKLKWSTAAIALGFVGVGAATWVYFSGKGSLGIKKYKLS